MEIKIYKDKELLENSKLKEYKLLAKQVAELALTDFDTLEEYNDLKKEVSEVQKKVNAFAENEIKPIKQAFDAAKKVVLDLEKQIVDKIKEAKKTFEAEAIEKGIILPKIVVVKIDCCGDCGSTNIIKKEVVK
jgi:hypothetical protein